MLRRGIKVMKPDLAEAKVSALEFIDRNPKERRGDIERRMDSLMR